jgi:hypothetical protein
MNNHSPVVADASHTSSNGSVKGCIIDFLTYKIYVPASHKFRKPYQGGQNTEQEQRLAEDMDYAELYWIVELAPQTD